MAGRGAERATCSNFKGVLRGCSQSQGCNFLMRASLPWRGSTVWRGTRRGSSSARLWTWGVLQTRILAAGCATPRGARGRPRRALTLWCVRSPSSQTSSVCLGRACAAAGMLQKLTCRHGRACVGGMPAALSCLATRHNLVPACSRARRWGSRERHTNGRWRKARGYGVLPTQCMRQKARWGTSMTSRCACTSRATASCPQSAASPSTTAGGASCACGATSSEGRSHRPCSSFPTGVSHSAGTPRPRPAPCAPRSRLHGAGGRRS